MQAMPMRSWQAPTPQEKGRKAKGTMAIFSMNFHTVSRQPKNPNLRVSGRSAVAAVAYALTTSLRDERLGKTFNYAHGKQAKSKETHDLGLYFPGGKRIFQKGRDYLGAYSEFWSKVELAEKRKDARTARTIVVALPVEMEQSEHKSCLEKFQGYLADKYGMASQIGIHYDHKHNPHAHIITTTRKVTPTGELGEKIRVLDSARSAHYEIKKIGEAWAEINNQILIPKYGVSITHKSYQEQGIDKPKGEHLGPAEWRKRQAEIDQEILKLDRELNGLLHQDNRTGRGTVDRTKKPSLTGLQGTDRSANTQNAPGSIQQKISGSNSRGIRKISAEILQGNAREDGARDQPLEAGSDFYEANRQAGNRDARAKSRAHGLSNESRKPARPTATETLSNHERRAAPAKRSVAGNSEPAKRDGQPIDEPGDNRESEILKRLEWIDIALTMLADKFEIEQIRQAAEPNLFTRIDQALDGMQTKFDMEFLRGEHDGQAAKADEAKSESGSRIHFRLS